MAGMDKSFDGEARLTDGFTVGLLEQEPQLNPERTSSATSKKRSPRRAHLLTEYEQLSEKLGEVTDPDEMEKLLESPGRRAGQDRSAQRLGARPASRNRDGRDEPAARRRRRQDALRRRAAPRGAVQNPAGAARPAAAGRADQPPRCRERRLARAAPGRVPGHGRGRDARSLFPRQRRRLDSGARPRPGHPVGRQLLVLARAEAGPAGGRRKAGHRSAEDARPRIGMDSRFGQGPAGQEQGPHPGLRKDGGRAVRRPARRTGNPNSARPAAGRHGHRSHEPGQSRTATA